jgi:hypothetical protein
MKSSKMRKILKTAIEYLSTVGGGAAFIISIVGVLIFIPPFVSVPIIVTLGVVSGCYGVYVGWKTVNAEEAKTLLEEAEALQQKELLKTMHMGIAKMIEAETMVETKLEKVEHRFEEKMQQKENSRSQKAVPHYKPRHAKVSESFSYDVPNEEKKFESSQSSISYATPQSTPELTPRMINAMSTPELRQRTLEHAAKKQLKNSSRAQIQINLEGKSDESTSSNSNSGSKSANTTPETECRSLPAVTPETKRRIMGVDFKSETNQRAVDASVKKVEDKKHHSSKPQIQINFGKLPAFFTLKRDKSGMTIATGPVEEKQQEEKTETNHHRVTLG